ncbi:phosphoadenylyl-sulfate reductase [Neisseria sp.]|uniref:phosphoadenylyl-sulfate reductase n=1 Tax=Neisseria sp. TaxID=192066 RepID=UPI0035A093DF
MSLFRPEFWKIPAVGQADAARLPELENMLEQRLQGIAERFPRAVFATSLAVEDMVVTDMLCRLKLPVRIVTLHTGRLNPETETLIARTDEQYGIGIEVFAPDTDSAERFEREYGAASIYESVERRRECCRIRKIEPLNRALSDAPAWLTGQRRSQSDTRTELPFEEADTARGIAKFNPIFDWEETDVWAYAQKHAVPLNALYSQGYPSIGCEPCTRPVKLGDPVRSGRWWWESTDSKECGLHK